MFVLLGFIILTVASILLLWKYLNRDSDFWKNQGVFQLDIGSIAPAWKRLTMIIPPDVVELRLYQALEDEKFGGFTQMGDKILYVKDLEMLKRIFVKDFEYFKDRRSFGLGKGKGDSIMSKMLSLKNGTEWKELRSAMSPAFTTSRIRVMFQFFNACGHEMAAYLKGSDGNTIDFQDVFGRFTLGAIASIAFGYDAGTFRHKESTFRNMLKRMQAFGFWRLIKFMVQFFLPRLAYLFRLNMMDQVSTNYFIGILEKVIQHRRETGDKREDFLQMMLDVQAGRLKLEEKDLLSMNTYEKDALLSQDDTTSHAKKFALDFDDMTVMAQSLLFFIAGSDTIEFVLTFAAYDLALNPGAQERLAAEVAPVMNASGGNLNYEDTQSLQYLDMVVMETLRLHPPAFAAERQVSMDYTIPGTNVVLPKGAKVIASIVGMHKDPKYYEEPEKFNPDNFSPEKKAERHPYTWSPFGQGPRNCIAMRFALLEVKAAIAHLVYNFKVEPCEKTEIPVKTQKFGIRKPVNGMWLKFTPRDNIKDSISLT